MRPTRGEMVLAAACALWVAGFLLTDPQAGLTPSVVVTPVAVIGVLLSRRRPLSAAVLTAGALFAGTGLGVPVENPAGLFPALLVSYAVGRSGRGWRGLVAVSMLAAMDADPTELVVLDFAFGLFLLTATWTFGVVVRRRTRAALLADADRAALAVTDPAAARARAVMAERARLAGDAVSVIHSAVTDMERMAAASEHSLDPASLRSIQGRGAAAVAELRRLLGLLREPPAPLAEHGPGPPDRRPAWHVDVLTSVGVAGVGVVDVLQVPGTSQEPVSIALSAMMYAALTVRRTAPALACALAAAPMAMALLLGTETSQGYAELLVLGLLSWTAAGRAERTSWASFGLLGSITAASTLVEGQGNLPLVLALLGVPAFAGYAWHERDRERRAAEHEAATMRQDIDDAIRAAVRAERLRIARELHDVSSHAVGVMVLQAAAAESLAPRSPADARSALIAVRAAGAQARAELAVLGGVLEAESPVTDCARPPDLREALLAVAAQVEATGSPVELTIGEPPEDPQVAAVMFRVVQEALTNAARHATGSPVSVTSSRSKAGLEISVTNTAGRRRSHVGGTGFGLVGLAERVSALGGHLSAHARHDGGFEVIARLPEQPGARPDGPLAARQEAP